MISFRRRKTIRDFFSSLFRGCFIIEKAFKNSCKYFNTSSTTKCCLERLLYSGDLQSSDLWQWPIKAVLRDFGSKLIFVIARIVRSRHEGQFHQIWAENFSRLIGSSLVIDVSGPKFLTLFVQLSLEMGQAECFEPEPSLSLSLRRWWASRKS